MTEKQLNVVALVKKNQERFIFVYDDQSLPQLLDQLQKYVDDPELEFDAEDAEVLLDRIFPEKQPSPSRIQQSLD